MRIIFSQNLQAGIVNQDCPGCIEETGGNCILIMNEKGKISSKSAQGVEEGNEDDNLGETMPA